MIDVTGLPVPQISSFARNCIQRAYNNTIAVLFPRLLFTLHFVPGSVGFADAVYRSIVKRWLLQWVLLIVTRLSCSIVC